MPFQPTLLRSAVAALALCPALAGAESVAPDKTAVVATYIDIAEATYGDSLAAARELDAAIKALIATPSSETMQTARAAWIAARKPYMQTEAFRFGNPEIDAIEGEVNSWPLDEGLMDYVDPGYGGATDENPLAALNVIATPSFQLNGETVDAGKITPELIAGKLQGADDVETNVATGWHAIEFLLWGQDLHGTDAGAGERPWTDYARGDACTHGNCDRRADYLQSASTLLVADLQRMADVWAQGGAARERLEADPDAAIGAMFTGLGSLSFGELAGERMKLGLILHDPEEEHDCFSDNTANSHYYDVVGIRNVYLGQYTRTDGSVVEGPSLSDLVASADVAVDDELRALIEKSLEAVAAIKAASDGGEAYDQQLASGNAEGNARIQAAVDALVAQTRGIERAIAVLGAESSIEGSDSLQ